MNDSDPKKQKTKAISSHLRINKPMRELIPLTKEELLITKSQKAPVDSSDFGVHTVKEEPRPLPKIPQSKSAKANHQEADFLVQQRLGRAIRQLREANQWTQHELAVLSDIHKSYFTDIERGLYGLSVGKLSRIAKALDVSMARLFEIAGL